MRSQEVLLEKQFMGLMDFDMDEAITCEVCAQTVGARRSLVARLARQGLLETLESQAGEPLLPRRAIVQLRRMQRLHHDLGVNFAGAAIILDLVGRIEQLNREIAAGKVMSDE
jgi:chaperone modulatory protein CbpM